MIENILILFLGPAPYMIGAVALPAAAHLVASNDSPICPLQL